MDPVCFHIGTRPVYWFGVLAAAGFGAALAHWTRLAKRAGKAPEYASDIVLWIMIGGILGARIAYVVANWQQYTRDWAGIFRVDQGGLIFYGGFIGGLLAIVLLARRRGENLVDLGDFVISGIPLGHALGRVGCFLNGCCHGECTQHWIGVVAGGRQPTQLYEALGNLGIYYFVAHLYERKRFPGQVVAVYMIAYPALRFAMEFLRGDERQMFGPLSVAQWMSLAILAAGIAGWRFWQRNGVRSSHALGTHTPG
jgi:phosphatidylglycerol:prolipoprotein diacylglycerol transferase